MVAYSGPSTFSNGSVSQFNYAPYQTASARSPNPTLFNQTDFTARTLGVRYVRILAPAWQYINFRERE